MPRHSEWNEYFDAKTKNAMNFKFLQIYKLSLKGELPSKTIARSSEDQQDGVQERWRTNMEGLTMQADTDRLRSEKGGKHRISGGSSSGLAARAAAWREGGNHHHPPYNIREHTASVPILKCLFHPEYNSSLRRSRKFRRTSKGRKKMKRSLGQLPLLLHFLPFS